MTTCSFDLNAAATFSSTSNHLQKMTQEEHSKTFEGILEPVRFHFNRCAHGITQHVAATT